jgi:PncC family amidohydrolase
MTQNELAERVAERLGERCVVTAESCTAGRVAEQLADVPSASDVLRGALVAYQDEAKRKLLGVTASSMVTEEAAAQMAAGACALFDAEVAVATTGVAGEDPVDGVEPGTVFIATSIDGRVTARRHRWDPTNGDVREHATVQALRDLCADLSESPPR